MTRQTRHLAISGRVQRVGFRWALRAQACALGLCGWVRNRNDGSVETLICGTPEAVDALTEWAWLGPPAARVERVLSQDQPNAPPSEMTSGFELHPTF